MSGAMCQVIIVKKFRAYQQCPTLQEYVLVNTAYPAVELLRRERNNLWSYYVFGPEGEVELTSLEVRFRVATVYEDVTFPLRTTTHRHREGHPL